MQVNPPNMIEVVHVPARENSIVWEDKGGEGREMEGPEQGRPAKGLHPSPGGGASIQVYKSTFKITNIEWSQ